ncbi:hypothetical protein [Actinomadura decatromicini]|uniref:hypothetical protein n=1 Tax=Actinomadura decatromicini TaxID=2604572 RepID=UPI001CA36F2C|nr:hypothetical protein [Actinomadura decatromicini]
MTDPERTVTNPRQDRVHLTHYHFGHTAIFSARVDQRCSWCAYIPSSYERDGDRAYPLAVVLHGTERDVLGYRDQFAAWGEENDCIVLSPLLPAGIPGQRDLHNYHWVRYKGIRFDHILLGIVDEARDLYRVDGDRFLLHGFSGGGHFTHRFLYLHPRRLLGASIGAPGVVTLLDPDRPWWVGIGGVEHEFGQGVDIEAVRQVPVQMVVGDQDLDEWEITLDPGDSMWQEGINDTGRTRPERLRSLRDSFAGHGAAPRFDLVEGAVHDGFQVLEPVKEFFGEVLAAHRKNPEEAA